MYILNKIVLYANNGHYKNSYIWNYGFNKAIYVAKHVKLGFEPAHKEMVLHPHSLSRAIAVRSHNKGNYRKPLTESHISGPSE